MMLTQNESAGTKLHAGLTLKVPDLPRILIVCDNDSDTDRLKTAFRKAGLTSESANSITTGCEAAKSGRFQVVFSTPLLGDGSWKRLIDVAQHYDLSFEVVLLARTFNLNQWTEALQDGAFDVLDVLYDLPKAAEAAKRALGTAYLKRFRPRPSASVGLRGGPEGTPPLGGANEF
jgi:DNA-binding NtrC family response regulator